MKKILFITATLLSIFSTSAVNAQKNNSKNDVWVSDDRKAMFEGVTGVMVFNIYNSNNYLWELVKANKMEKEEALKQSKNQVSTIVYILEKTNALIELETKANEVKKSDIKYYKDLKKSLLLLKAQADLVVNKVEGQNIADKRFDDIKKQTWNSVTQVMNKE